MAVNLIRKNNQPNVTAYQDAVLFHAIKGENGVFPNVGTAFKLTYNPSSKKATIGSGMGMIYGRQFEIAQGEEVEMDWSALAVGTYVSVYVEVDLRDPTTETATFKATYSATGYPIVATGNDLISLPKGLSRMLMYQVDIKASGITAVQKYSTYKYNYVAKSGYAEEANRATLAVNSTKIGGQTVGYNDSRRALEISYKFSSGMNVIEMKQSILSKPVEFFQSKDIGKKLELSGYVNPGDILEIHYEYSQTEAMDYNSYSIFRGPIVETWEKNAQGKRRPGVELTDVGISSSAGPGFGLIGIIFTTGSSYGGTSLEYRGGGGLSFFASDNRVVIRDRVKFRVDKVYKIIGGNS